MIFSEDADLKSAKKAVLITASIAVLFPLIITEETVITLIFIRGTISNLEVIEIFLLLVLTYQQVVLGLRGMTFINDLELKRYKSQVDAINDHFKEEGETRRKEMDVQSFKVMLDAAEKHVGAMNQSDKLVSRKIIIDLIIPSIFGIGALIWLVGNLFCTWTP